MKNYSDYNNFNYRKIFWGKHQRDYEDAADKRAIQKIISPTSWFLDLGGGFGRLIPVYQEEMDNIILMDSSIELLREAREEYKNLSKVHLICADATKLPFHNKAINATLVFRVLHCINEKDLLLVFKELERVINSTVYLEFANKRNLSRVLRYFAGNKEINIFNEKPEQVNNSFFNFSFPYLKKLIKNNTSFKIEQITRLSFFRHPWFKKFIPISFLQSLEAILQNYWPWNTTPSILLKLTKQQATIEKVNKIEDFMELIVCPYCHHHLEINPTDLNCSHCGRLFLREKQILNFRV